MGRRRANPVGFYLALYDSGEVAKIAYDEVFFVYQLNPADPNEITVSPVFPKQAGVPYTSLSYEENWATYSPPQQPPIGYPVLDDEKQAVPDNGAFESLVGLSRLLASSLEREVVWDTLGRNRKEFSLADVQRGAAKIGLQLQSRKLTLDEVQKTGSPAILYLSDSSRLVTLSALDEQEAIVLDQGRTRIVSRETLQKRYAGEALIAEAASKAPSRVLVEDGIRLLRLKNKDEEATQQVKITNNGKEPVTLQVEHPIPGVTRAELSSDTVNPGGSVTLSLIFKWRQALKGESQNVFVFVRTNDPARPRLHLGFQLTAPKP
jgi:hypothetical protein